MQRPGLSRRELLRRGAGGAAVAFAPGLFGAYAAAAGPARERVVIVGAGLAGLSCADRLQRAGITPAVFDANPDRLGGRCWTSRGWADGQTAEHGGEFIDSRHRRMQGLARRFGLELSDLYAAPNPGSPRLWLNARLRRRSGLGPEWMLFERRIRAAAKRVGAYSAAHHTRAAVEFDELTVADWLDRELPGGSRGVVGQYVWAEMASEFGLDATRLSALNLFYEYAESTPGADERFHVAGGNDQTVSALAAALPDGTIRQGAELEALRERSDGRLRLRFGGGAGEVIADHIVLAIPFTTLRRVDLDRSGLSRRKRRCINELGMGTNAKVLMQFAARPHDYGDWNGYGYGDAPFVTWWESTLGQPGAGSIITTYFGGRSGAADLRAAGAHAATVPRETTRNLAGLDRGGRMRLDGITAGFTGQAWTDRWVSDPWARGSYAAFLPGQYTRYYGYAGRPEGRIHFAGEHTATANQGFLEGAVESGQRTAAEILRARR